MFRSLTRLLLGGVLLVGTLAGCSAEESATPTSAGTTASRTSSSKPPTKAAAKASAKKPTAAQKFSITPDSFDAGRIGHRHKRDWDFAVENKTDAPLQLGPPKPSCGCIKLTFDAETPLAPGEKRTGVIHGSYGVGMKKFEKVVLFPLADGSERIRVPLRAHLHPGVEREPIIVRPLALIGGDIPESRNIITIQKEASARNNGEPLLVENVRIEEPRNAEFTVTPRQVSEHEYALVLEAKPGRREGPIRCYVRCEVNGLALEVEAKGYQYQHVVRRPQFFAFGRIHDAKSAERRVEMFAADGQTIDVIESEFVAGKRTEMDFDLLVEPGQNGGKILVARPRAPFPVKGGSLSGTFRVRTSHPTRPMVTVPVNGYYSPK